MTLVFTSEKFKIGLYPYEGFPLLLLPTLEIFNEAFQFMLFHCVHRGRVRSKNSWVTYGRDLYDYFAFLEANELDWKNNRKITNFNTLVIYRDASISKFNLSENTVNRRLRLIVKFYNFAVSKRWVDELPFDYEDVKLRTNKTFLAHTDRSGGVKQTPDILLKVKKTNVKVLSICQIKMLLDSIDDLQLKLMVRFTLCTGLRKEELLTFPKKYIFNPRNYNAKSHHVVYLSPNDMRLKGGRERSIHIPKSLMEDLWQYVIHTRSVLASKSESDSEELFLNNKGEKYSHLSNTLNLRLSSLNLPFHVFPHILRHTYATHTLKQLQEMDGISFNPLLYVRDRLGHESITTTERYLHFIDDISDVTLNDYQKYIDGLFSEK